VGIRRPGIYDDDEVTHFQTTTIYNISIQKHGES
ncbi:MAG: hypothetical protein ACI90V_008718, partial [Bacillariaceae sp.]